MSGKTGRAITDADLVALEPDGVHVVAGRLFPTFTARQIREFPDDALLIDVLVKRWVEDPEIVPQGYALGHAHGHTPDADAELKKIFPAQLADQARRHVASFHPRALEATVERANREAKTVFVERIREEVERRVVEDPELLEVVVAGNAELRGIVQERLGRARRADGDTPQAPLDGPQALAVVQDDAALVVAVKASARADEAAYGKVIETDPELAAAANAQARETATEIIRAFEAKRDAELGEISTMADQLASSAPATEADGGERGVLLDLQHEVHDDEQRRWVTHRVYRWVTYAELQGRGPEIVGELRAELDALLADDTKVGPLRMVVSKPNGVT